jgi:hypothetical protein
LGEAWAMPKLKTENEKVKTKRKRKENTRDLRIDI